MCGWVSFLVSFVGGRSQFPGLCLEGVDGDGRCDVAR